MPSSKTERVAILFSGDRRTRETATPSSTRFASISQALSELGADVECAVYHDEFCSEVRAQLLQVDAALVWVNPIVNGRDRSMLDAMLRDVASHGVFVSAHPDVILRLGTKEVLHRTRKLGWGCDTHLYRSVEELRSGLLRSVEGDRARVLKQHRGQSGDGVWKVERAGAADAAARNEAAAREHDPLLRVRHAKRGSDEEVVALSTFLRRCEDYFRDDGLMIDQAYQSRLPEGMIRCYLVQDRVHGFGHQAINALCPAPPGMPASAAPQPTPRLYHPPTVAAFAPLKAILEREWLPAVQRLLEIETRELPVLWDCDFLLGPRDASGKDTYVLCEINVSSVAPFPDSVVSPVAAATLSMLRERSKPR